MIRLRSDPKKSQLRPRRGALDPATGLLLGVLMLLLAGPVAGAERPPLSSLPEPALDVMSDDVRDQLETARSTLETMIRDPDADEPELAARYGEVGGLYLLYQIYSAAIVSFENAAALEPENFRWFYLLGVCHQTEGQLIEATRAFRETLALEPSYVAGIVRLGLLEIDLGRLDDAQPLLERAIELQPSSAAAYFGLGRIADERDDPEQAVAAFERVLELQPTASSVRFPLAQALLRLGRREEAEVHLATHGPREVAIPDPLLLRVRARATGAAAHSVRAQRALDRGDIEIALAEFELAKQADPENAPTRRALALALRRSGQLEAAVAEYLAVLDLEPANPLNHQDFALTLTDLGRLDEAIIRFRRAIELSETYAEAHHGLGVALARSGEDLEAVAAFRRAIELDQFEPELHFELAKSLMRLGKKEDAQQSLEALVRIDPGHASGLFNLAYLLELDGAFDTAERHNRAALESDPPARLAALLHLSLGRIAERRRDPEAALAEYQAASTADPDLVPAYLRRASVLAAGGGYEEAVKAYDLFLTRQPGHPFARLASASAQILAGDCVAAAANLESGLEATTGPAPQLAATLALVYAGCDDSGNDTPRGRARDLARGAFSALGDVRSGQILAYTLSGVGLFEDAARAQERILQDLNSESPEAAGLGAVIAAAEERLTAYRARTHPPRPWLRDSSLLTAPYVALPPIQ